MAVYAEAIRLCYRIEDEATEATLVRQRQRILLASSDTTLTRSLLLLQTSQLQKLQRHADTLARVEALATESTRDDGLESERKRFKAAFDNLATPNGLLAKNQLKPLAKELGTLVPLSDNEVDGIWKQVRGSWPTDSVEAVNSRQCALPSRQLNSETLRSLDASPAATSEISFERLWRWWISEAAYELADSETAM
ncbi:hypothetical protein BBJ28_00015761 [Nothophytophthora sp. Chile5]|nr:hypothetical protein BBJ28_00015761 [Nothophytophthora sp. Chile5]